MKRSSRIAGGSEVREEQIGRGPYCKQKKTATGRSSSVEVAGRSGGESGLPLFGPAISREADTCEADHHQGPRRGFWYTT